MHSLPFLELPLIAAPMAGGASTVELAAAVSNAGGLGSLAAAYLQPEAIRRQSAQLRLQTQRPFAINLFIDTPEPAPGDLLRRAHERLRVFRDELGIPHPPDPPIAVLDYRLQFEAILTERPAVFSFTFGIPDAGVLTRCRTAGIFTIGTANTVAEGVALQAAGVDAVCAQGFEAGGHHGAFIAEPDDSIVGTLALVPQLVDALDVPVIAAGGIGDGRGIAAVLALGARAAQVGSAFLLADESGIPSAYRRALLSERSATTRLTNAFSGRYARGVRNRFIDEMTGSSDLAPFPYQNTLTRDIRAAAAAQDRDEFLSLWAGQAVGLARALPAAEIVAALMRDANTAAQAAAGTLRTQFA